MFLDDKYKSQIVGSVEMHHLGKNNIPCFLFYLLSCLLTHIQKHYLIFNTNWLC